MTSTPTRRLAPFRAAARILAGLLVTPAAVLALAAPAHAATHAVVIQGYAYSPASLTVEQGDTVTWTNQDTVEHDVMVTSGPATFHSPMLAKGQSWSHTFTTAGSYSYICSVHPDMKASVTVRPRPSPAPTVATHAPTHPQTHPQSHSQAHPSAASAPAAATAKRAATPADPQVAAPATEQVSTPVLEGAATLNPLLLVAGASTAVMVFCLLLMTTRPAARPNAATDD